MSFNPFQDEAYSFTQSKKVRVEVKRKVLIKFKFGRVFSNSEKQVSKETEIMNFIGQRAADDLWLALTFVRLIKLYLDRYAFTQICLNILQINRRVKHL